MAQAVICPVCNGKGKVCDDTKPCHGCGGKGWVEVGVSDYPWYPQPIYPTYPTYPTWIYPYWTTTTIYHDNT